MELLLLVQGWRLGGLQLQMILLGGGIMGGWVGGGCRHRLLLILTCLLILIDVIRMMEVMGVGVGVRLPRARPVGVWVGMRVRVRVAPGVILLPRSGGIHVCHPIAFFAPHSESLSNPPPAFLASLTTFRISFPFFHLRRCFSIFFWSSLFLVLRRTVFIRLYRVFFGWLEKLIGKNTGGFVPRDWGTDRFGSQFKHHLFYCTWRMVVRFLILNRNISYTLDASLILCILDKEVNTIFFLRQREVCPGEKNNPS